MNTNTADKRKALKWARANANLDGKPRWLHIWGGVFWISKTPIEGSTKINPSDA